MTANNMSEEFNAWAFDVSPKLFTAEYTYRLALLDTHYNKVAFTDYQPLTDASQYRAIFEKAKGLGCSFILEIDTWDDDEAWTHHSSIAVIDGKRLHRTRTYAGHFVINTFC